MGYHFTILLLLALLSTGTLAESKQLSTPELPIFSRVYDPDRDAFADARAAIDLASKTQRGVLIELGGDWCRWCHRLEGFLKDHPALWQRLHSQFVVLKVNVSDANDNADFLSAFPETQGYPHMFVARGNGSVVHSQDTLEFLVEGRYSEPRFHAFLDRWAHLAHSKQRQTNRPQPEASP